MENFPDLLGDEIPSHQTIENWVELCGLSINNHACSEIRGDYAIICDESITIGSQKLLLFLGVPAKHLNRPLRHSDVQPLGIYVSSYWKAEDIAMKLKQIIEKIGYDPEYVLSDEGHNLVKATQLAGLKHHKDISHAMGNMLKHTYQEDAEFKVLTEEMGKKRLSYHLTDKAYLLQPNMRSICRFMNCFDWVNWAYRMNHSNALSAEEREAFSFVKEHSDLVDELYDVMNTINYVEKEIKQHGLSYWISRKCQHQILHSLILGKQSRRKIVLGTNMISYLLEEAKLLPDKSTTHQLSSDIIESTFGYFKRRKSPNNLNGVTAFSLIIPAHTKMSIDNNEEFNFKQALESVSYPDLIHWKKENLLTNWVSIRRKKLVG